MNIDWIKRASAYFLDYVEVDNPAALISEGMLSSAAIRQAAKMLLDEKVFLSKRSMQADAIKSYDVFLPDTLFPNQYWQAG